MLDHSWVFVNKCVLTSHLAQVITVDAVLVIKSLPTTHTIVMTSMNVLCLGNVVINVKTSRVALSVPAMMATS